jgi:hypothetical protein
MIFTSNTSIYIPLHAVAVRKHLELNFSEYAVYALLNVLKVRFKALIDPLSTNSSISTSV